MGKLDHNLDAYRLAASALERMRALLRRHLEAVHGEDWESLGIPDDPREFLRQRRERESSVKWNSSSSADLLDYAGFVNLYEVVANDPQLRQGFSRLVPEPAALRLRFLELDTVLNRIGYARPVAESDMELLLGFDERLRQIAGALTGTPQVHAEESVAPGKPPGDGGHRPRAAAQSSPAPPASPVPQPPPVAPAPPPAAAAQPPAQHDEPQRRPGRDRATTAPTAPAPPAHSEPERPSPTAPQQKELEAALRRGDDAVLLTALYLEITSLAERLWSDGASAGSPVWDLVSESSWYRERFSALRLKVVSDFYDLLRAVDERRAAGAGRSQLHDLLKERNFAHLLMDLREFFKPLVGAGKRSPGR